MTLGVLGVLITIIQDQDGMSIKFKNGKAETIGSFFKEMKAFAATRKGKQVYPIDFFDQENISIDKIESLFGIHKGELEEMLGDDKDDLKMVLSILEQTFKVVRNQIPTNDEFGDKIRFLTDAKKAFKNLVVSVSFILYLDSEGENVTNEIKELENGVEEYAKRIRAFDKSLGDALKVFNKALEVFLEKDDKSKVDEAKEKHKPIKSLRPPFWERYPKAVGTVLLIVGVVALVGFGLTFMASPFGVLVLGVVPMVVGVGVVSGALLNVVFYNPRTSLAPINGILNYFGIRKLDTLVARKCQTNWLRNEDKRYWWEIRVVAKGSLFFVAVVLLAVFFPELVASAALLFATSKVIAAIGVPALFVGLCGTALCVDAFQLIRSHIRGEEKEERRSSIIAEEQGHSKNNNRRQEPSVENTTNTISSKGSGVTSNIVEVSGRQVIEVSPEESEAENVEAPINTTNCLSCEQTLKGFSPIGEDYKEAYGNSFDQHVESKAVNEEVRINTTNLLSCEQTLKGFSPIGEDHKKAHGNPFDQHVAGTPPKALVLKGASSDLGSSVVEKEAQGKWEPPMAARPRLRSA